MDNSSVALIIGGSATLVTAIGALIYTSPGRAWKLLVEDLNYRVKSLEQERDGYKASMHEAESQVRRLRTIRSILEDIIRGLGGTVPSFHNGEHPDVAPERRSTGGAADTLG